MEHLTYKHILIYGGVIGACGLFTWEYLANIQKYNYKPSLILNKLEFGLRKVFNKMGCCYAKLSGFIFYFRPNKFIKTSYDLLSSIYNICVSPCYFLKGYLETSKKYRFLLLIMLG